MSLRGVATHAVERFATAAAFLDAAGEHLAAREAYHNLPLAIARACRDEPDRYPGRNYYAVVRGAGRIEGVALMTPPHRLQLYVPTGPSIDASATDLADAGLELGGVHGPTDTAEAFARTWCDAHRRSAQRESDLRAFELTRVIPAPPTPGAMRLAVAADLLVVEAWFLAFSAETHSSPGATTPAEHARRAVRDGRLVVWDRGGAVAQAAALGDTPRGARVGIVYTPPEHRRHGYATALVGALSQHLLDRGRAFCFLFTDLANPVSNAIYPKVGYRPVADYRNLDFAAR